MKSLLSLYFALAITLAYSQSNDVYFTLEPALTPDASTIIFSHHGDLWQVPTAGGTATRMTAMEGEERRPNVSPDGKWLAFSNNQLGNHDIYIMPMNGGDIQQLTYHDSNDDVDSWSWDSQSIYFTSGRYNRFSGYEVSINGGTPTRLFDHYFDNSHNIVEHPINNKIYFNETWESKNFANRKRYKGDYNPNIKTIDRKTNKLEKLTSWKGKDFGATIDKSGKVYFKSDEANDEYNLYTFEGSEKKQLTNFDTSVMWPKVSADGRKIVFRKDYQIHIYDVVTNETSKPNIIISDALKIDKSQSFSVGGKISAFSVASDNKKLAFISRGRLFISDTKGKFVKEIKTDSNQSVGEVHWLKDNQSLIYSMTKGGYYNYYRMSVSDEVSVQITDNTQNNRLLSFNSDKSKAVYISGRNEVRLLNLSTFASETIVTDELWGFYNSMPYFSPDDEYVLYDAYRNFENDIFAYHIPSRKSINLTHTKVSEGGEFWSPDGKYVYFHSDRLQPSYPYGTRNAHIYRIALDKFDEPFTSDKLAALFQEKKADDKEKEDKKDEADKENKPKVSINTDDIMKRIERIGPSFGQQFAPYVIQDGDKTTILYLSNHEKGESGLWKTTMEPFEESKTERISSKRINGYQIEQADGKYYLLTGGDLHTLDIGGGKLEPIKINHKFNKTLKSEFDQMFYEAWAGFEENFYDENFHGQNWQDLRDRYSTYLDHINSRSDLRLLFNEMLGELNASHFGFRSSGDEEETTYGNRIAALGLEFETDAPFTIKRIIKDGPADKADKDIMAGDRIISINDTDINPSMNRNAYLSNPDRLQEVKLSLNRNGMLKEVKLHPISSGAQRNLLYDEWQDANQSYVDNQSNNKIGYVHMKNMTGGQLTAFKEDMISEASYKDGLILDLRYNTGGNVHDDVLQFLSQRAYLQWKYREGTKTNQPNFNPSDKPIVLLINEQSLSDAEMTAAGFKELGLGTIVGTETYRWIIFTTGNGLVDGSFYRLPSWGCYTLDGKDLELHGVAPDIRVDENFEDRIKGNQPQLDKAIQIILDKLK